MGTRYHPSPIPSPTSPNHRYIPTKFSHNTMSNQGSYMQTGAPTLAPPATSQYAAPPQVMVTPQYAPQPAMYAPQRQVIQDEGDKLCGLPIAKRGEGTCGPLSLIVACCIPCGCWICLCPIDRA